MAKSKKGTGTSEEISKRQPQSLAIASKGITTGQDFAMLMSALMSDMIAGSVKPMIGNAVCNAGGKLLKVVEMQFKYGTTQQSDGQKILFLTSATQADGPVFPIQE